MTTQMGEPRAAPLKTVDELLAWQPSSPLEDGVDCCSTELPQVCLALEALESTILLCNLCCAALPLPVLLVYELMWLAEPAAHSCTLS